MKSLSQKVVILTVLILSAVSFAGTYSGGGGVEDNPYQISRVEDWQELMATPDDWGSSFILTADVNLAGVPLTPVGNFTGVFDGNDNIISNAVINQLGSGGIGLFGYLGEGGQIRNLGVEDVNMTGSRSVGGLVGYNYYGTLTSCYATGSVHGIGLVGGLVGYNGGTLISCYATCSVSGTGYYSVGGLVGYNSSGGTLTACYATGSVTGSSYYVGGLVGRNSGYYGGGTITACYATGLVTGTGENSYVGGLVGYNDGYYGGGTITACYAIGSVTGTGLYSSVGGLVGENWEGTLKSCYATGAVTGTYDVGGLVGYNYYGTLKSCYAIGSVTGTGLYSSVGGLVGENGGTLISCYATCSVSETGENSSVGGLVGGNYGSITACYATTGSVSETGENSSVGGLVGYNGGTLTGCYATGSVTGTERVGGLVGENDGRVFGNFWDTQTSGWTTSAGGTGKTTAEMMMLSTFIDAGWDFVGETANGMNDYWLMCVDGVDYPRLAWENQPPLSNAGAEQTVYAWIDGFADVTLDGSDSNDADGNALTYKWTWTIDANMYEANGVSPTIELPAGVHTIQLVVNDGHADSAPDDVNVTVVAPLEGNLKITPQTINRKSNQPDIRASIKLPGNITKNDVDISEPLVLYPDGIKATSQKVLPAGNGSQELNEVVASFGKTALMNVVPTGGNIELKVAGKLKSGQYFYGRDTVRIIH
jgi:hypothetical protein